MAPQYQENIKHRLNVKEPKLYDVVMLNDDFTTMDFVVDVLVSTFYHPMDEANKIMMAIHQQGMAIVGTYVYDIAVSKSEQAQEKARDAGFPLRLKIQEHKQ